MAGRFILSLDFECGWGSIENGMWKSREQAGVYEDLRPTLIRFIKLLDSLEMSFTWATVGGMIDPEVFKKTDHLRGRYALQVSEFLRDAKPETKDGRDLFDMVMNARVKQVIESHTYTHVSFKDKEQAAETYLTDLKQSKAYLKKLGVCIDTLVFPMNVAGYYDQVVEAGFKKARLAPVNRFKSSVPNRRINSALDQIVLPPPPVSETLDASGLLLHHGSMFLNWGYHGSRLKQYITKSNASAAIKGSVSKSETIHMWLHPFNLVETRGLYNHVEKLLVSIAKYRDAGQIETSAF